MKHRQQFGDWGRSTLTAARSKRSRQAAGSRQAKRSILPWAGGLFWRTPAPLDAERGDHRRGRVDQDLPGTLALTALPGANTYSGGTNLNGGILAVNNDSNLGTGALSFNGGTLEALAAGGGFTSSKAVRSCRGRGDFFGGRRHRFDAERGDHRRGRMDQGRPGHVDSKWCEHLRGCDIGERRDIAGRFSNRVQPQLCIYSEFQLDLNGFSNTIGSLAGNGIVTNNGPHLATLSIGNDNTNTTFSGSLQDGRKHEPYQVGTGMLTLTGISTYTGRTIINGGALQLGNGGTTGSITGNVTNNGILAFNRERRCDLFGE